MAINQQITSAPPAPQRSDPNTFADKADAFVAWLENLDDELNQWASECNSTEDNINTLHDETQTYKDQAQQAASDAETYKNQAQQSASETETYKNQAQQAATESDNNLREFKGRYYGAYDSAPTTDPFGDPIEEGDMYWDTTQKELKIWNGSEWEVGSIYDQFNADSLHGYQPSQIAQANIIPVTKENGKLDREFLDLSDYELPAPTVSTVDIYENGSGIHTITNYDPEATYEIVSHDSLITDITIENDKINITTGDITDDQDHTVSYVLRVSGITGWLYNETTVNFTIKYLNLTSDDAIIVEDSTYTEDSFDTIYNGELAA